jgi:hypothetical protein
MAISVFPVPIAASKTRYAVTLISGTSYTVPAGVTRLNVELFGGGGSSGAAYSGTRSAGGTTTMTGATSAAGGQSGTQSTTGDGTAGLTYGAVNGGNGGFGQFSSRYASAGGNASSIKSSFTVTPGASIAYAIGAGGAGTDSSTGGNGKIDIEYWV